MTALSAGEARALSARARASIGCACGELRHDRLQWDHLPEHTKRANVADMCTASGSGMARYSLEAIVAEIRKCRVICGSCHQAHTAQQRGLGDPTLGDLSLDALVALESILSGYRG